MSKIDIFKWREAEFQKKFEENGYNWLDVKSRLEKISESEKIDKKLEDLQWRVEDYYEYLVSLYEKAKKEEDWDKIEELIIEIKNLSVL